MRAFVQILRHRESSMTLYELADLLQKYLSIAGPGKCDWPDAPLALPGGKPKFSAGNGCTSGCDVCVTDGRCLSSGCRAGYIRTIMGELVSRDCHKDLIYVETDTGVGRCDACGSGCTSCSSRGTCVGCDQELLFDTSGL